MSISAVVSSTIIKGNVIISGTSTADNTTITTYSYDECIFTSGDAIISSNYLSGVNSNTSTSKMIDISSANCQITANTFVRGNSNINSYVNMSGSNGQIITNNIFDNTTVDGTSEVLVANITADTIYTQNKNQTAYKAINLLSGGAGYWDENPFNYVYFNPFPIAGNTNVTNSFIATKSPLNGDGYGYPNQNTYLILGAFAAVASGQILGWHTTVDLTDELPDNVQVLGVKVGVSGSHTGTILTTGASAGNNLQALQMQLTSYPLVSANFATGTGSILDTLTTSAYTRVAAPQIDMTNANLVSLQTTSQYLSASGFGTQFATNTGTEIIAEINLIMTPNNTGSFTFAISPLVVKYRW